MTKRARFHDLDKIFLFILDLEFWMFGIIFISCLSKGNTKKHQKCSLWLVAVIGTILKVSLIIIDKFEDDKKDIFS